MKRLVADSSLCIGCRKCEETCSTAFYKDNDPLKSCIKITETENGKFNVNVCTQCGICAEVCNSGLITPAPNGVWRLNKKECVGCLMCVGYCPNQVMARSDDHSEPSKCTACGLCVKNCPTGAIKLVEE